MAFEMKCPHCMKRLRVTEKAFGKTVPCPGCNRPVTVPQSPDTSLPQHPVGVQAAPQRAPSSTGRGREVPQQPVNPQGASVAVTRPSAAAAPAVHLPPGMPPFPEAVSPTHTRPSQSLASCPRCGQSFQGGARSRAERCIVRGATLSSRCQVVSR